MNAKEFFLTLLFILIFIGGYIYVHESTHKVIFQEYGCTNVKFGFIEGGITDTAFTTTANCTMIPVEEHRDMRLAQALTETVQYPIPFILVLLILILLHTQVVVVKQ